MIAGGHAQREEVGHESAPTPLQAPRRAYVAEVVTPSELLHFVQAHGGGERAVAWLARRQLGVVTFAQLIDAQIGRGVIAGRLANGWLHHRHRGVYLVGSPVPQPGATELAAVLACGDGALISGRSAAGLRGLARPRESVDVTVIGRHCRPRPGIEVTCVGQLDPRDRADVTGIPATAPARMLIDFAATATADELEAALSEARAQRLVTDAQIEAALDRARNRRGVARMRAILRAESESGYTRSKAERLMKRLLRDARLPQPVCNQPVGRYSADFLWAEQRLVVEVDSFKFHGHRGAFERDRRKDQALQIAGYRVIRVTWRQLNQEPLAVIAAIAAALAL
jgi:very-short-patch-repair endonuclease